MRIASLIAASSIGAGWRAVVIGMGLGIAGLVCPTGLAFAQEATEVEAIEEAEAAEEPPADVAEVEVVEVEAVEVEADEVGMATEEVAAEVDVVVVEEAAAGFIDFPAAVDRQAQMQTVIGELRPVVQLEVGFLFRVCQPTDEQKQIIRERAEENLQAMTDIADVAGNQAPRPQAVIQNLIRGNRARLVVAQTNSGQQLYENPYSRAQKDLMKVAQEVLSPEQVAAYAKECDAREQFLRESAVDVAVQMLTDRLALSDEQQQQLREGLLDKWDNALNMEISSYANNPQYLPPLPSGVLNPILDSKQRAIWGNVHQVTFPLQVNPSPFGGQWDE